MLHSIPVIILLGNIFEWKGELAAQMQLGRWDFDEASSVHVKRLQFLDADKVAVAARVRSSALLYHCSISALGFVLLV